MYVLHNVTVGGMDNEGYKYINIVVAIQNGDLRLNAPTGEMQ